MKDQPKSFYTRFDDEGKDVTYSDKGFEKIAVNFVGIETSYNKCRATFFSKSKLHNHLKSGYQEVVSPFLSLEATFSIPIIAFKAVHQSFGSGIAFRG